MGRKLLCITLSIVLAISMSANVFADETVKGKEQVVVSVVEQFIGEIIDIPLTAIDDKNTAADETTNTVYGKEEGYSFSTGDLKEGDDDQEYNYTVNTILKKGSITIKTTNVAVTKNSKNIKLDYLHNTVKPSGRGGNDLKTGYTDIKASEDVADQIGEDYEYIYLGEDKISEFVTAHGWSEPHVEDDTPTYKDDKYTVYVFNSSNQGGTFDKYGCKVERYYLGDDIIEAGLGKYFYARYADMQQFVLSDADGNLLTAYCADQTTDAEEGYRYNIENLEDATYYSKDEAAKMRVIAYNGYWGAEKGIGSLDAVKKMMKESGKFKQSEIDSLTDGMAMMATQYAIWTYSNVNDKVVFLNAYHKIGARQYEPALKKDTDLIFKLYRHLVSLEPETSGDEKTNQRAIINENNFIDKASIQITDSLVDAPENNDADDTNDVFKADISFKLIMTPEELEGDELVMTIKDGDNNVLATGVVAGTKLPGKTLLTPDENDMYTFEDVPMHEGAQNIKFDFSGKQEVDMAPYLLTSEVKNGVPSQTFVCIASGDRDVAMTMDVTCEITVDAEELEARHTYKEPPNDPPSKETETGDTFNMTLAVALLLISMTVAAFAFHRKKYN